MAVASGEVDDAWGSGIEAVGSGVAVGAKVGADRDAGDSVKLVLVLVCVLVHAAATSSTAA